MMLEKLLKARVEFVVSDPFELAGETFRGVVEAVDEKHVGGAILIKLNDSISYEAVSYGYFVASPRHEGGDLNSLLNHEAVSCGLTHTTAEKAASDKPCDVSWWRGGLGIIGGVRLV